MQNVESALAVSEVRWQPCFRVIPSRYPTIHLFERVADPAEWETLYWIESLTNPRLRDEVGDIELVPPEERAFGPGGSVIMAPFTHLDPAGSRFADGTFGAFYAAASLATSVAETCFHREVFLRATRARPIGAGHAQLPGGCVGVVSRHPRQTGTACPTSTIPTAIFLPRCSVGN